MASAFKRLIPTLNRVLVRKLEAETVTKSGIILSQPDDKTPIGVIVATGPGKLLPLNVSVGDTVVLPDFGGTKVNLQEAELFVYRDSEIVGVLKK